MEEAKTKTKTVKDEEERKLLRPSVDVSTAVRLCNETWEVSGANSVKEERVVELDGYDDRNFLVRVGGEANASSSGGDDDDDDAKKGKYVLRIKIVSKCVRIFSWP